MRGFGGKDPGWAENAGAENAGAEKEIAGRIQVSAPLRTVRQGSLLPFAWKAEDRSGPRGDPAPGSGEAEGQGEGV